LIHDFDRAVFQRDEAEVVALWNFYCFLETKALGPELQTARRFSHVAPGLIY
jgi:hypothetical protein